MASVVDEDMGFSNILRQYEGLSKEAVEVGIFADKVSNADGATVVEYMTYNEMGTLNIPPRPAFRNCFDANIEQITAYMASAVRRRPDIAMKLVGEKYVSIQKAYITSIGKFAPLSPNTIKQKGSTKPLIDTATALNSITYEEVKK